MKRKFDIFSILAIVFTLWYLLVTIVYFSGFDLAYPIIWIATLGRIFYNEAFMFLAAWAPVLAIIIGVAGWINREKEYKAFMILPCFCLVAPLLILFIPQGVGFLYRAMPIISLVALIIWIIVDLLMIIKDRKA